MGQAAWSCSEAGLWNPVPAERACLGHPTQQRKYKLLQCIKKGLVLELVGHGAGQRSFLYFEYVRIAFVFSLAEKGGEERETGVR